MTHQSLRLVLALMLLAVLMSLQIAATADARSLSLAVAGWSGVVAVQDGYGNITVLAPERGCACNRDAQALLGTTYSGQTVVCKCTQCAP